MMATGSTGPRGLDDTRSCRNEWRNSCDSKRENAPGVDCTSEMTTCQNSTTSDLNHRADGTRRLTGKSFIDTATTRKRPATTGPLKVLMTRARLLRSRMLGNSHVRF